MSLVDYKWRQIAGGPRLAVAYLPSSQCAAFSIYIPAGSRDEVGVPVGLAHFVEHMIFKGTKRRSAREINLEIENVGGEMNASTSEDQTAYEATGEAETLPILIDVISDMVWHSTFLESEITIERDVIAEEITMHRESAGDHIGDLISQALWPAHPLGNPVSGTLESIGKIGRSALIAFRDEHYFRSDTVVAVASPFPEDEVLALLLPHMPKHFHAGKTALPFERGEVFSQNISEARETDQLQLALAWHSVSKCSPMRYALRLLSLMLGETASSRLFEELREQRGLCYQIASDVSFFADTGAFVICAGLDPESREEAIACIMQEVNAMVSDGPSELELSRAKRLAISRSKLAFETTGAHAAWVGEGLLDFGEVPSVEAWREKVAAATVSEVKEIARQIFHNQAPAIAEIRPLRKN